MDSLDVEKSDNKKYLPSKKFVRVFGVLLLCTLVVLVATSFFKTRKVFNANETAGSKTLGEVVTKDSNKNGIADWEESLWGLDPNADGQKNKSQIVERRASAGLPTLEEAEQTVDVTETARFTRELLTTILALQQSGELTSDALVRISESMGQDLEERREVANSYSITDLSIVETNSTSARASFRQDIEMIVATYEASDIGNEFELIGVELAKEEGEPSLASILPIADTYAELAKELIATPTPSAAAYDVLMLANASDRLARALRKISAFPTDSLLGIIGIDEYLQEQNSFDRAVENLAVYFTEN